MDRVDAGQDAQPIVKPYFFPENFDFSALRKPVQIAIVEIVVPLYEELTLGAATNLEKSFGASFAVIATIELDLQFDVVATLNFSGMASAEERATRDQLSARLLHVISAKTKTAHMLARLQAHREKREQGDG